MNNLNTIDASLFTQADLVSEIIAYLDGEAGYIIVKNLNLSINDIELSISEFIRFSKQIGEPKPHDNSEIVWHIKHRPSTTSKIKTYSEHNDEAPFHTDAQYRPNPENYFALLTLKKAICGGGISSIITASSIKKILATDPMGAEITKLFTETNLPFAVPSVFSLSRLGIENEVTFATIFYDTNKIRYRFDTLMKGLEYYPDTISQNQKDLIIHFDNILNLSNDAIEFTLDNGDLLFINNETVLHKRTSFKDINRHLLRIRLDRPQG